MASTPEKPTGYTFEAVRSSTGILHLRYATGKYPEVDGRLLCSRRVPPQAWDLVGAREWYTAQRRCMLCRGAIGPYATVRMMWT